MERERDRNQSRTQHSLSEYFRWTGRVMWLGTGYTLETSRYVATIFTPRLTEGNMETQKVTPKVTWPESSGQESWAQAA